MSDGARTHDELWLRVIAATEALAAARSMDSVVAVLRDSAREIACADGIVVVLRDGEFCLYAAEDAQTPLWTGRRFPVSECLSGWVMEGGETTVVADAMADPRAPKAADASTLVRSLVMVPIGRPYAEAALGAYWDSVRQPDPGEIVRLEALARSAAIAIENVRLASDRRRMEDELRLVAETLEQRVEERTAELERIQEAFREAQKLEAMGQLTGGVAHDFNNLLMPIMGTLDTLQRHGVGDAREQRLIRGAMQSAERARMLVQRLLAFARRQPLTPEPVDVADLMAGLGHLLGTTAGPRIAIGIEAEPGLPPAFADAHQLELAVLNLVVNARDAMPDGGSLMVSARARRTGPGAGRLKEGDYVVIAVADSGTGMSEEVAARAIEPFFSTKGVGKGTGLGLSMVHGLMSQLGGGLSIDSRPGEGTTVEMWIPVAEGPPAARRPADAETKVSGASGTVLLVDDEALVRASIADMLTEMGYEVVEAADGGEALTVLDGGRHVDVLITDHLMPVMTGIELTSAARGRLPGLGVLLMSGYADIAGVPPGLARLQKPFLQAELEAGMRQVRGAP